MAKRLVKIDLINSEDGTIYVLSQSIKGLSTYDRAKAIERFISKETKVLETCIENDLRVFLRANNVIPYDGSEQALNDAFVKLECKGKSIAIVDRYKTLDNEKIIGESENRMTVIIEDDVLSAAMEVIVNE